MEFNTSKLWNYKVCFQLLLIFSASLCIKMALIPAYYSTDHDVHQNWLRITGTKPLSEWYFDVISMILRRKVNGLLIIPRFSHTSN